MPALLLVPVVALLTLVLGVTVLVRARGPAALLGLGSRRSRRLWAVVALLGGLLLAAGVRVPLVTFFGAALLAALALVTLAAQPLRRSDPARSRRVGAGAATGLLAAGLLVGAVQPLGLKVMLLPHADVLPRTPVPTSVVKTYGPGMWFEGVEAAPDGTLYLAESTGEDYARGDKSAVRAQVIERSPEGAERVLLSLPQGSTAGVMAVAPDRTLFLAVTGRQRGLWRVGPDGHGALLAPLPEGSFPNGVTLAADGSVYVADSALGTIWRVDPDTGAVRRAYTGAALRARRFVALPPGANGVHAFRGALYVTNSDAGTLLRLPLHGDGSLGDPEVLVRGVPADDFAVVDDGTVYLTTHIYDTVVRVDPSGRRTVVADEQQGLVGATDCALVRRPDGSLVLYVVTDGGALATGDARAAGTLVALDLRP